MPDQVTDYVATVTGGAGPPVLLLAGGAASSHGFFPGVADALPGHRIVSLDRPGTGRAQAAGAATLPTGSAAVARVLTELDAGPAVILGQSLGALLAVQVATDHPELVAGLLLIDPTPVDLPGQLRSVSRLSRVIALPGKLPVLGPRVDRALFRLMGRQLEATPQTEEAIEVLLTSASLDATARATRTLEADAAALAPRLTRLDGPVVLLTADRPADHPVRASHERLVLALGGRLVAPAGAIHAEQARDPDGINALLRDVVAQAFGGTTHR